MFGFNLKDTNRGSIHSFNDVFIKPSQKHVIDREHKKEKERIAAEEIEKKKTAEMLAMRAAEEEIFRIEADESAREAAARIAAEEEAASAQEVKE